jgi:heme/copper-type cytochrome/quinol oxidase subunit 3
MLWLMFNICTLELHAYGTEDCSWRATCRKVWDTNQNFVNTTLLLYSSFVYSEADVMHLHDNRKQNLESATFLNSLSSVALSKETSVFMKVMVYWHVMPCSLAVGHHHCQGTCFLCTQVRRAVTVGLSVSSTTMIPSYQTVQSHIAEDHNNILTTMNTSCLSHSIYSCLFMLQSFFE